MGMAKLKIAGAWSGVLEVELEEWTVSMLREEVIRRSGCVAPPESINLICAGKLLKDGDGTEKLSQLGIKNNAKVLASKVSPDRGKSFKEESLAEEERSSRLSRLKAAATSLAQRHAEGSLPVEDFNLELENQSGEKVQLGSDTDQRAIMMGLMLHANGKALIRREQYKEALEVLTMGEEAFSLCNPKVIEMVDNVAILQIDLVWCYFMLQDISWLSVAGIRLAKAREGLERAHGKEASRVRLLQGGRYPEIALHVRLELLEGVVGYHSGQFEKARQSLSSAQAKYFQLQIPDEALSVLLSMGYKEGDAKKALRMNNQDVQSAVNFLVEEKEKAANKREEDRRRQREILEQKCYGMTPLRKAVNLQYLYELVSIGFEKELAAEALRRNENDTQKALDDLTNPETNSAIQLHIESKKKKRLRQEENATIEQLVAMGFPRERVVTAVRTFGTRQAALNHLLEQSNSSSAMAADESASSLSNNGGEDGNPPITNNDGGDTVGADTDASGSNADSTGPSHSEVEEERDVEMEDELTGELLRGDAYSDYDLDIMKEGEAITQYLTLLTSAK
nr:NEDD8 ultimate buster 1 [Ipomoea trifida]